MEQTTQVASAPTVGMPGFFSLLGETFSLYGRKWKSLFKIILASFGIILAAILIMVLATAAIVFIAAFAGALGIILGVIAAFAGIVGYVYLFSWIGAAMIVVLRDRRENIGFREIMKRAKPYVGNYFTVSVLSGLITVLGFILLVIPGIIFSIWYMFAVYLVVTDNEKGMLAISKSRELVRGYFWNIFLLGLLGWIMSFAFQMLMSAINIPALDFLTSLLLTTPVSLIYSYLIFDHIRSIKGGSATTINAPANQKSLKVLAALGLIVLLVGVGLAVAFAPQISTYIEQNQPQKQNSFLGPNN